jgi:uncharacterized membrane protein YgcG
MSHRASRVATIVVSAALLSTVAGLARPILADDQPSASKSSSRGNNVSRRALDRPVPEIKFNGSSLSDVIDFLADATAANISVDWKALDAAHIAKDTPITLKMSSQIPLHKVLKLVLDQAAGSGVLTFYVDEGVIEITSQEASDKILYSRVYPIQDLLFQPTDYNDAPSLSLQTAGQGQSGGGGGGGGGGGSGQSLFSDTGSSSSSKSATAQTDRAQEIIKLITDTVKPELWQANGGTATISFFRGNLIVNAPRSIHEQLESQ